MKQITCKKHITILVMTMLLLSSAMGLSLFSNVLSVKAVAATSMKDTKQEKAGYIQKDTKAMNKTTLKAQEGTGVGRVITSVESANTYSKYSDTYAYSQLTSAEKKVYLVLKNSAYKFHSSTSSAKKVTYDDGSTGYYTGSIDVSSYNVHTKDMNKIMFAFEMDHPILYWFEGIGYQYRYSDDKVTNISILVAKDYRNGTTRNKVTATVTKGMKPYLAKIDALKKEKVSEMDLEVAIHDMIVSAVDYAYTKAGNPVTDEWAHNIHGVFAKKGVVCEGYAKTFQLLMNYAGMDCITAIGWGNGASHSWNLVKIDGKWYNVDVTWDDMGNTMQEFFNGATYDYFNCLDSFFKIGHRYDSASFPEMYKVPKVTTSSKYTYYQYYGLEIEKTTLATEQKAVAAIVNGVTNSSKRKDYVLRIHVPDNAKSLMKKKYKTVLEQVEKQMNKRGYYLKIDYTAYGYMGREDQSTVFYFPMQIIKVSGIKNGTTYFEQLPIKVTAYSGKKAKDLTNSISKTEENGTTTVKYKKINLGTYKIKTVQPKVTYLDSVVYSGKSQKPKVKVKVGSITLAEQKDYKITYYDNKKIGKAKIVITGIGDYAGTKEVYFIIKPAKVTGISATPSSNKVSIMWGKEADVTGYQVVYATKADGKYQTLKFTTTNKLVYTKLTKGKVYYIKTRAYVVINSKKMYGEYSKTIKFRAK